MRIAVILGNRMKDDGTISETCVARCRLALEILNNQLAEKLILSGGVANKKAGVSEASAMKEYLISHGADETKLILEEQSTTTAENAKHSIPLAVNLGADEIIICTTLPHLTRKYLNPLSLFKKQLKAYPDIKLLAFSGE